MARRSAATASRPMAKPPFMSPVPRPRIQPPEVTGWNGSPDHTAGSAGTTSTCPLNSSDGEAPGLSRPRTLSRPA